MVPNRATHHIWVVQFKVIIFERKSFRDVKKLRKNWTIQTEKYQKHLQNHTGKYILLLWSCRFWNNDPDFWTKKDLMNTVWNAALPVDTARKLNVHKTFRRNRGRLLNVLCTFNLRPVSTGLLIKLESTFCELHGLKTCWFLLFLI